MNTLGPLADHARVLLAGTGIDPTEAAAIACGQVRADSAAAHALAQGWAAAGHSGVEPPVPATSAEADEGRAS